MAKKKTYNVQMKKKQENKINISGGYCSSLTGVSQSERSELFTLSRRGSGVFENKKRKRSLKPKHKNKSYSDYSCAFNFALTPCKENKKDDNMVAIISYCINPRSIALINISS